MKKPKILSVDDEASFTELLQHYFEPRGYEVDVASGGDRALELLRQKKYDVVLLDLKMAGRNGDEVMREIKCLDTAVKTIFITAYGDPGKTRERLLKEGAYAFVEKPIASLKSLEELVNEAVEEDEEGGCHAKVAGC